LQGKEATTTLAFGKLGGADAALRQKDRKGSSISHRMRH